MTSDWEIGIYPVLFAFSAYPETVATFTMLIDIPYLWSVPIQYPLPR
jgi:hypothetical protein